MVTTSREAWETLASYFVAQSTARAMHIRNELNPTKKLDTTTTIYLNKTKGFADALSAMGLPLHPDEFTGYIYQGLHNEYDSLVQLDSARALTDPMTVCGVYTQLLETKKRKDACRAELSANTQMMAH
jgi:hypothetical protein